MNVPRRLRRSRNALATVAVITPLAILAGSQASASASVLRTAQLTSYNTATFLQDNLGFSSSDTSPVVQPVTYDEFQWLLQQSGNSAFLIGDPGQDPNFKAEAQDVEATAEADGIKQIYWFNPNLSGGTGTSAGTTVSSATSGKIYEPNLDIQNPSGITALATASQVTYGYAWLNIVGQYLGDGVTASPKSQDTESATVSATTGTTTSNDYGSNSGYSTEIVNGSVVNTGGALYNYPTATTSGTPFATPAASTDSYFFIYNGANTVTPASSTPQPEKIVSWVDLDSEYAAGGTSGAAAQIATDVTAAINTPGASTGAVGASNLTNYSQFDWWESEATLKNNTADTSDADGLNVPLLTSANDQASDGGWKVDQITYPELVDLLKNGANSSQAVILFGGTWCPNTRPVLPFVNQYAQENNTTVFNFDTVLDGGTVGGTTTGSNNPLQSRNSASYTPNGQATETNANPTFLYGDLVNTYLQNVNTQYTVSSGQDVTYYPGGNTSATEQTANKLQVPFLIGYQASNGGGVTRQWIINNGNDSYSEYMSDWWYTNPQPNELGVSSANLPQDAPYWSTIDSELSTVTYATDPATLDPNSAVYSDDAEFLDSNDYATLTFSGTYPNVTFKSASDVNNPSTVTSADVPINPTALSQALAALGSQAPTNLSTAETALVAAYNADTTVTTLSPLTSELETVVGAWDVVASRKSKITGVWGSDTNPASVLGGLAADNALDVFFAGLPGGVISTQTVTADAINNGAAVKINVAIANQFGRLPTGNVSLTLTQGGSTVATQSAAVVNNLATFTVPISAGGSYSYTVSYAGDSQIAPFTDSGTITVTEPTTSAPATVTVISAPAPTTTATPAAVVRSKVSKVRGAISKLATTKTHGRYLATLVTPNGRATATGKVTIKLKKGKVTKTVRAELQDDRATFTLPKLAAGKWTVKITWAGDGNYVSASGTGAAIKVA